MKCGKLLILFSFICLLFTKGVEAFEVSENWIWRISLFAFLSTELATNPINADSFSIEFGRSKEAIEMYRLRLNFNYKSYFDGKLKLYFSFSYSKWNNLKNYSDKDANNVLDFNPVFSLKLSKNVFLCYSSGLSFFSANHIGTKKFGGYFSFNHFTKVLFKIKKLLLKLGMQHYSNNGIFYPNDGINFYFLSIGWKY